MNEKWIPSFIGLVALPIGLAASALAQQPTTIPADEHNRLMQSVIVGRDEQHSALQNQIAALRVELLKLRDAAKDCKPKDAEK